MACAAVLVRRRRRGGPARGSAHRRRSVAFAARATPFTCLRARPARVRLLSSASLRDLNPVVAPVEDNVSTAANHARLQQSSRSGSLVLVDALGDLPVLVPSPRRPPVRVSVPGVAAPRLTVELDEETTSIVRRLAKPNRAAAFVRRAVIAQAERDEFLGELAEIQAAYGRLVARVELIERRLGIEP